MSRAQLTSTDQQNNGGPVSPFVAGKNAVINGDFSIWQRGTTFNACTTGTYTADRWVGGYVNGTVNVTQQAFTAGAAPVAGYESKYYLNLARTSTAGINDYFGSKLEDVRLFAGQTVTFSFWAKSLNANKSILFYLNQSFGSGGSTAVDIAPSTVANLTTSWARYSATFTVPSVASKTIGAGSYLETVFALQTSDGNNTWSIWGVQLEAGSVATPFTTASGTLQGELALCQRYYYRIVSPANSGTNIGLSNYGTAATSVYVGVTVPQMATMRTAPASIDYSSNLVISPDELNSSISVSALTLSAFSNTNNLSVLATVSGASQYRPYRLYGTTTSTYLGFSAEL